MGRASKRVQALEYLCAVYREYGALPMPSALEQSGIYSAKWARRQYRIWLKEGLIEQPEVLGGVYVPTPKLGQTVLEAQKTRESESD